MKSFRVKELTGCWRDGGIQILNDWGAGRRNLWASPYWKGFWTLLGTFKPRAKTRHWFQPPKLVLKAHHCVFYQVILVLKVGLGQPLLCPAGVNKDQRGGDPPVVGGDPHSSSQLCRLSFETSCCDAGAGVKTKWCRSSAEGPDVFKLNAVWATLEHLHLLTGLKSLTSICNRLGSGAVSHDSWGNCSSCGHLVGGWWSWRQRGWKATSLSDLDHQLPRIQSQPEAVAREKQRAQGKEWCFLAILGSWFWLRAWCIMLLSWKIILLRLLPKSFIKVLQQSTLWQTCTSPSQGGWCPVGQDHPRGRGFSDPSTGPASCITSALGLRSSPSEDWGTWGQTTEGGSCHSHTALSAACASEDRAFHSQTRVARSPGNENYTFKEASLASSLSKSKLSPWLCAGPCVPFEPRFWLRDVS